MSYLRDGNLGVRDVVVVDARGVGEDRLSPLLHVVEVQHHLRARVRARQPSVGRSNGQRPVTAGSGSVWHLSSNEFGLFFARCTLSKAASGNAS